jgi:hypothetical protein
MKKIKILITLIFLPSMILAQNPDEATSNYSQRQLMQKGFEITTEAHRVVLVGETSSSGLTFFDTTVAVSTTPKQLFSLVTATFNIYNTSGVNTLYITADSTTSGGVPVKSGYYWTSNGLQNVNSVWVRSSGSDSIVVSVRRTP